MADSRRTEVGRRRPRTWGSVRRLRSGSYQARTGPDPVTGERATVGTFDRRADADAALAAAHEQLRTGSFAPPRAGRVTLTEQAAKWQATRSTRPTTAARDEAYLRSLVLPHLGHLELGRIDASVLRRWITQLARAGKQPATIVKAHQIASMVLAQATADRLIASNPASLVDNLPRIPAANRRALTDVEVAHLAAAMDPRYRPLVLLGAFCALRPGELVALLCSDMDLLRRTVRVQRTATYVNSKHLVVGPPKTNAGLRTVPMPTEVATTLQHHIEHFGLSSKSLLFPATGGGYLRMNNWTRRYWKPAIATAGIDPPIVPHQLRHTAITRWVQEGVDPVTVARRSGHTSAVTILDIYARASDGEVPADERVSARAKMVLDELARAQRGHAGGTVADLTVHRSGQNPA